MTQNYHFIYEKDGVLQDGESCFLVCVGKRPKAPLLGKGYMSCTSGHSISNH